MMIKKRIQNTLFTIDYDKTTENYTFAVNSNKKVSLYSSKYTYDDLLNLMDLVLTAIRKYPEDHIPEKVNIPEDTSKND